MIPVEDISLEEALQVRRYKVSPAKVEELAKDIVTRGQIQPVLSAEASDRQREVRHHCWGYSRPSHCPHQSANKMMNGAGPCKLPPKSWKCQTWRRSPPV